MNQILIAAILAFAIVGATYAIMPVYAVVDDDSGLTHEENYGQCNKNFNDNACAANKDKFTGSD